MIAKVIVDVSSAGASKVFDYLCPFSVQIGNEVLVPFGGRNVSGIVVELSESSTVDSSLLKPITKILDGGIPKHLVDLAKVMCEKYFVGFADSLRLFLPRKVRGDGQKEKTFFVCSLKDPVEATRLKETLSKRNEKQKQIIEYLLKNEEAPLSVVAEKFGRNNAKTLKDKGILLQKTAFLTRDPKVEIIQKDPVKLTKYQQEVKEKVLSKMGVYLIHGVTGCGKTEVYLSIAEEVLKQGKNVILLVPEISLTPQMFGIVRGRFGPLVAVLHSGLSDGERYDEWKRIQKGEARVVVGARSALFAPLANLGMIFIDEEHDDSYKSETNPRYDAREVAASLAEISGCSLVLGRATPSLESYHAAMTHKYQLLEMPYRVTGREMPPIEIVNMTHEFQNGNTSDISHTLEEEISKALKNGEQVMLFQNRRGFNSFVQCKECGWVAKCPNCDVSLVYHKHDGVLKCHFCGNRFKMFDKCPECGSENLVSGSAGTQKIVEEIQKLFPAARVLRMDNDTTRGKDAHAKILQEFREKKADILVGTQMIAKGHDFPSVTVVGIIDADISLHQTSYAAAEKTFALITQVAGRAGRADKQGKVVLQTRSPRHYVYRFATEYDYISFYKKEANLREITKYPPFSKILRILVRSESQELAKQTTMLYYEKVKEIQKEHKQDFFFLGAMKSPVGKIEGKFRFQILMRVKCESPVQKLINKLVSSKQKNVFVFVETNPTNLS